MIELAVLGGSGKVDVSLERDGRKIACEISITSPSEQELANIQKCLAAGYDKVVLCSPDRKTLETVHALEEKNLSQAEMQKVMFFQPEDLFFYLEKEAAEAASEEARVRGYKVKVQYQPVNEAEKKAKREAVANVIVQALKRMKNK
jgi:hypothetical protein